MPVTEAVNEWTFTGDVQSWVNEIIHDHPGLPFSEGMPQGTIAVIVSQIIASVLVIVYGIRAWREPYRSIK